MTEAKLYYTAPSDECFNELKEAAIELWSTMGDDPSYSQEKIGRIKDIQNVQDNFMYILAMFDIHNKRLVGNAVSEETRQALRERLIDGGQPEEFMPF